MTSAPGTITSGSYSHDLLLHDSDAQLVGGVRAFVEQGLATGSRVIVHSSERSVAMLHDAIGDRPHLEYALDRDLYQSPSSTLFAYQRALAESPDAGDLWACGTVPLNDDATSNSAWGRYESLVNEALGEYAFHGLCAYDTQRLPGTAIAAARATHPHVSTSAGRAVSPEYEHPAQYLTSPLAAVPDPPDLPPTATLTLQSLNDLSWVRRTLGSSVRLSTVPEEKARGFLTAVNEVLANGLLHAGSPVGLTLWTEPARLTARVTDEGPGIDNPLAGYRYPGPAEPRGLWVARQLCENVFLGSGPDGGSAVLLSTE